MKVALDTNVLAYAEGVNDEVKRAAALQLLTALPQESVVVPVQVLGELFNVLVRKAGRSRVDARQALLSWGDAFAQLDTSPAAMSAAADLSVDHPLGIWDAVIPSSTSMAGCRLLLSEDMQEGFTWGGVAVANPFAVNRHPLLEAALDR